MRFAAPLALLAGLAAAHGGRGTQQPATTGPQVFRHGGVDSAPKTLGGSKTKGGWETWWAYNREYIISKRMRGVPISGTRLPVNDKLTRKTLREERLYDLMVRALDDKSHLVQSSAAVALGKFGMARANRPLDRHSRFPGEGWFDVREGALYAMGILGLSENRVTFKVIAGDKQRPIKERGMALVGLARDGTQGSIDLVTWHLNYHRSSLRQGAHQMPTVAEEEKRRVAAHMLGFARHADVDALLYRVALGSRRWGDACQGLAVTALGRRRATDYAESLFRLMARRDTPDVVKQSIPIALGMMIVRTSQSDTRRLARFIRDYRRDNLVQHFAAMGLADIGGPQATELLIDLIRDNVINDDRDRAWLYLALGQVAATSPKAQDVLRNLYEKARTEETRASLALACGMGRVKGAVPITIKLLDRAQPPGAEPGRRGAARPTSKARANFMTYGLLGLGLHGDKRGVDIARKVFRKKSHPVARHNAAIALALIKRKDAIPELLAVLKETGVQYTKAAVILALGLMPEPTEQLVRALIDAYEDDSNPDSVRAMAIIGLGMLADPRVIPLSATLTRRYNYHIRSNVMDELALIQ